MRVVTMATYIHTSMNNLVHTAKVVHTSVHAYRCTCIQVYMHTGVHAYRCTCLQVYMLTGVHAYKCTCIQVYMLTGVHAYKCTCIQVYMLTGVHVYMCIIQCIYHFAYVHTVYLYVGPSMGVRINMHRNAMLCVPNLFVLQRKRLSPILSCRRCWSLKLMKLRVLMEE